MQIDIDQWREFYAERVKGNSDLVRGYIRFIEFFAEKDMPPIFEERHLASLIGIPYENLLFYFSSSPHRYRSFNIPKRRGGLRTIKAPTPILLQIQRWILRNILHKLPMSEFAHGGVPGRSIVSNARPHLGAKAVLHLDLTNFFDNVPLAVGINTFRKAGYPPRLSRSLALLCFSDGCLPQGGATSSALGNQAALLLDKRLSGLAREFGLVYTRYVDDLTFSGDSIGPRIIPTIEHIVKQSRFSVNTEKTRLVRGSSPKFVTGLAVNGSELRVPRAFRRQVKNEAFQVLKRGITNHMNEKEISDPLILERILGKIAFWLYVEPKSKDAMHYFEQMSIYRKSIATEISLPEPRRIVSVSLPDGFTIDDFS